jgi:hypothetical protein
MCIREIIYQTTVRGEKWNGAYQGKPVQLGTYIWKLTFKYEKENSSTIQQAGNVNLIK